MVCYAMEILNSLHLIKTEPIQEYAYIFLALIHYLTLTLQIYIGVPALGMYTFPRLYDKFTVPQQMVQCLGTDFNHYQQQTNS